MIHKAIPALFLALLTALSACKKENGLEGPVLTTNQKALVDELNALAIPFSPNPLTVENDKLAFLDVLADAQIVGLGEATHGSKEFFEAKHRIFKYLAENMNHRAFGFECDFAESLYIDAYITTGTGNIDQIMKTKMHFWAWRTNEVKALLEWMKQYNQGKRQDEQLHFYGFDCQFTDMQPDLLLTYFDRTSPELYQRSRNILTQLKAISFNTNLSAVYTTYTDSLANIQRYLDTHRDLFIQKSSQKEWAITKQLVSTLQQALHVIDANNKKDYSVNWRDKYMADNVKWMSEFMGQNSKISLWAHNYHIGNHFNNSAGYYLTTLFGTSYQKIGFAFSTGNFTAHSTSGGLGTHSINQAPIESSINLLFHHAKQKNFVFPLHSLPSESGWKDFLSGNNSMLSIGSSYDGKPSSNYYFSPIGKSFDWLIYFDKVREAKQL
jgi:erythromycin esterase